jgi:hypothetical protein
MMPALRSARIWMKNPAPMRWVTVMGRLSFTSKGTRIMSYKGMVARTPNVLANEMEEAGIWAPDEPRRRSITSPG